MAFPPESSFGWPRSYHVMPKVSALKASCEVIVCDMLLPFWQGVSTREALNVHLANVHFDFRSGGRSWGVSNSSGLLHWKGSCH